MKQDKKEEVLMQDESSSGESDSSSSEDDENAELMTEELEEGFFKVLSHLKKKDSKLYEESITFFPGMSSEELVLPGSNRDTKLKKSQREYREWLKGKIEKVENEEVKEDLEALHDYWASPNLNKDERFLRDYILNKKFLEPDNSFNIEEEINKLSDEEREVEEQLIFEHKYNCRFENSDQGQVIQSKSKTKKKNKKADREKVLENGSTNHNISPQGGVEETTETTRKKKNKKSNKEMEKNSLVTEETLTVTKDVQLENQEFSPEMDTSTERHKCKKSHKRKRADSVQDSEETSTKITSSNVNSSQCDSLYPRTKSKKKKTRKIESSHSIEVGENVNKTLPKGERQQMAKIPRNQQMKNAKTKSKMRHRNRRRDIWRMSKKGEEHAERQISSHEVGNKRKKVDINMKVKKEQQKIFNKKQNNLNFKKSKNFQNLIVKEKKNKQLKFGKIHAKKQKASKFLANKSA